MCDVNTAVAITVMSVSYLSHVLSFLSNAIVV